MGNRLAHGYFSVNFSTVWGNNRPKPSGNEKNDPGYPKNIIHAHANTAAPLSQKPHDGVLKSGCELQLYAQCASGKLTLLAKSAHFRHLWPTKSV
jgi:hypothetical protein